MYRLIIAFVLSLISASAYAGGSQPPTIAGTRNVCQIREQAEICHIFGPGHGADRTTELRQATHGTEWQYVAGCLGGYLRYRRDGETCLGYWERKATKKLTEVEQLKVRVMDLQMALANEMSMAQTQDDIDHCSEVASHAPDTEHKDVFFQTCLKVQREARRNLLVKKGILPEVQ